MKTVFEALSGSELYGTQVEGSDRDTISTYVPSKPNHLFCITRGWNNGSQTIGEEEDARRYDVRYFVSLALRGQTAPLECLFVKPEHIVHADPAFQPLLERREDFLCSQMNLVGPAVGYAEAEYRAMFGKTTGKLGERRKLALAETGYVPKAAYHCLRIMGQTLHALHTGTYSPYPEDHDPTIKAITEIYMGEWLHYLISVKLGEVNTASLEHVYGALHRELEKYHVQRNKDTKLSPFPLQKDNNKASQINELLGELILKIVRKAS